MLYPLKFKAILKPLIWGGSKLVKAGKKLPKGIEKNSCIGESWEISDIDNNISIVANGFLKSNNLRELIEVYMGDLVGDKVYEKYGIEFPLLIKFIDACDNLSIQVHPDDDLAEQRHGTRGKTEMWYVVNCDEGASIYVGFRRDVTTEEYLQAVKKGALSELLMRYDVRKGDVFYIPAGTVHSIGKGVVIAEIQEASNITYRIDDWGRKDKDGNPRQLHIEESVDAINFKARSDYYRSTNVAANHATEVVSSPFFTTNVIKVNGVLSQNRSIYDSFTIYICVEGSIKISADDTNETLSSYESILIPAQVDEVVLSGNGVLLEVFIK